MPCSMLRFVSLWLTVLCVCAPLAFQNGTPQVGLWCVSWSATEYGQEAFGGGSPSQGGGMTGAGKASCPLSKRPTSIPTAFAPTAPLLPPPTADTVPSLCAWLSGTVHVLFL